MAAPQATLTASPSPALQHSLWHSPVPYLFGGLAAMLGLIAFALLILACSYWKLSGRLDGTGGGGDGDLEAGDGKPRESTVDGVQPVFEEKIVVIMAGDVKPTFLATPISTRANSSQLLGDGNDGRSKKKMEGGSEGIGDQKAKDHQITITTMNTSTTEDEETHETSGQNIASNQN